jgi:hypothetical protein
VAQEGQNSKKIGSNTDLILFWSSIIHKYLISLFNMKVVPVKEKTLRQYFVPSKANINFGLEAEFSVEAPKPVPALKGHKKIRNSLPPLEFSVSATKPSIVRAGDIEVSSSEDDIVTVSYLCTLKNKWSEGSIVLKKRESEKSTRQRLKGWIDSPLEFQNPKKFPKSITKPSKKLVELAAAFKELHKVCDRDIQIINNMVLITDNGRRATKILNFCIWLRGDRVYDCEGDRGTLQEFLDDCRNSSSQDFNRDEVRHRRSQTDLPPFPYASFMLAEEE